ncbi:MAG: glycosyltransferase family 4 protein [Bacteroidetes bacterium]|nr:MAG: glycosyltransferase family 4 protein [Bacteroidota bacterium]
MKILLLSDGNSAHTKRWAISLKQRGNDLALFSIARPADTWTEELQIPLFSPLTYKPGIFSSSLLLKSSFLRLVPSLKKAIRRFQPDVIHAHYASSYGLLGALTGFHPLVISVWGSDILIFPKKNIPAAGIMRFNFRKADAICSTSRIMVPAIRKYTRKEVELVPFGVDTGLFRPFRVERPFEPETFVMGTVKALEPEYGIDQLIRVFNLVKQRNPDRRIKLLLVGGGRLERDLRELVTTLGITQDVWFTGKIPHGEIPRYMNMLDLFVALSHTESFGVSVLEAASCEKPAVVSDVGGLPEVVENRKTGLVVRENDIEQAAGAVEELMNNPEMAETLGRNGRIQVEANYNWDLNVIRMTEIYQRLTEIRGNKYDSL